MGRIAPRRRRRRRGRQAAQPGGALRRDEVLVLQFLQDEL